MGNQQLVCRASQLPNGGILDIGVTHDLVLHFVVGGGIPIRHEFHQRGGASLMVSPYASDQAFEVDAGGVRISVIPSSRRLTRRREHDPRVGLGGLFIPPRCRGWFVVLQELFFLEVRR